MRERKKQKENNKLEVDETDHIVALTSKLVRSARTRLNDEKTKKRLR